jgi:hypothetical protein
MAFQVHTVSALTPSISLTCAFTRPIALVIHTQSSSAMPYWAARVRFM